MFSHVTLGTNNLDQAKKFYDAILSPVGLQQRVVEPDGGPKAACWIIEGQPLPRFYVYEPFDGNLAGVGNGTMVAFTAPTAEAVAASYCAGLDAGGTDEGEPDERPQYGSGYFGAYIRDPDGNKIHIVFRGDLV